LQKYSILDEDIYNFNKTGFQIEVILTAKIITGADRGRPMFGRRSNALDSYTGESSA
jgi:hypothetical protein